MLRLDRSGESLIELFPSLAIPQFGFEGRMESIQLSFFTSSLSGLYYPIFDLIMRNFIISGPSLVLEDTPGRSIHSLSIIHNILSLSPGDHRFLSAWR